MKDLASSKIISYLDLHRVTLKLFQKLMDFCEANIPTWEAGNFVVTMRNIRDFIWFLWEAVLKWIHWNGQFGVNASLNALRNGCSDQQWPLYTWQILPSGSLLTIIVFEKQDNYSTWFLFSWCSAAKSLAFSVTLSKKSPVLPWEIFNISIKQLTITQKHACGFIILPHEPVWQH